MDSKLLEVGLLLWWKGESKHQPIIITYVNRKKNCFRFITFSDNNETGNLRIMDKDKPSRILGELFKTDKEKIYEYLSKRKSEAQDKVNAALTVLHEAQRQFDFKNQAMNEEFTLEKNVKKTIQKFEGYMSNPE